MSIKRRWLFLLDLDGTLWDNEDISLLSLPFRKLDRDKIRDSNGIEIRLNREIVELTIWAKENGAITSTLSWNIPDNAMAALKTFHLTHLFDYITVENTHRKDSMILKLLRNIKNEHGIEFKPCEIVYIDDRDIHIKDIYRNVGPVNFLQAWRDFTTFKEGCRLINDALSRCK